MSPPKKDKKSDAVTTEDIAKRTGLSKMTVSRVLNDHPYVSEDTRKKVLAAVDELGFRPNVLAKRFFTGKTQLIGMIVPLAYMFRSSYFNELFHGIMRRLEEDDYDILLHDSMSQRTAPLDKCLNLVKGRLAEGLLLCAPMTYDDYPHKLQQEGVPLVVLGEAAKGEEMNRVSIPNRKSCEEAVTRLTELGHKNIAVLTFNSEHIEAQERYAGYKDALQEAGIAVDKELVRDAKYKTHDAFEATLDLLNTRKDITAIFATNADMAMGALQAIKSMDLRIPEDISLLAFDDYEEMEKTEPPITTVRQNPYEVGYKGADRLLKMLNGEPDGPPEHTLVDTEFVERDSIGPARS